MREIKTENISEVPIVDNEINNDISNNTPYWDYEKGNIICCGIFYGDKIKVLLKEKKDNLDSYKKLLKEELDKLPTMYAFNFLMEKGNFLGFLGKSYFIEEIKPFKGKGKNKQWFYEELVRDNRVKPSELTKDPIEDNSAEVLKLYEEEDYETIIQHNIADLIKQYMIWKHKQYLLSKYELHLNKDGWFSDIPDITKK